MTLSTVAPPISVDCDLSCGALGVDLNADHVALSRSSHDGNLLSFQRIPLVTYGQSAQRSAAVIGDAVKVIVAAALRTRVPLVVISFPEIGDIALRKSESNKDRKE